MNASMTGRVQKSNMTVSDRRKDVQFLRDCASRRLLLNQSE